LENSEDNFNSAILLLIPTILVGVIAVSLFLRKPTLRGLLRAKFTLSRGAFITLQFKCMYIHVQKYDTHSSLNIINNSCLGRITRGSVDHAAPQLNYHSNFNNGHPERPQTSGTSGAHNFSHHSCRGVYHRVISGLKHFQARRKFSWTICIRLHSAKLGV